MSKDALLQQAVADELEWEPTVNAAHIGVTARDGVVTLTGQVPTYWEKDAAERAAARVGGVRAVVEELRVELLGNPVADERIAWMPRPWARCRWNDAGTAALMSLMPGAMTPSRWPSHAEHSGSFSVVQFATRSPSADTTTDA